MSGVRSIQPNLIGLCKGDRVSWLGGAHPCIFHEYVLHREAYKPFARAFVSRVASGVRLRVLVRNLSIPVNEQIELGL